jgi:uncharacterized protein
MTTFEQTSEFWQQVVPTLPALIKAIAFFALWLILWLPLAIPVAKKLQWQPWQPLTSAQKLPLLASLYLIAPLMVWGTAQLEGKNWADYGWYWQPQTLISLGIGWLLGVLGLALMFGIQGGLGWVNWQPPQQPDSGEGEKKLNLTDALATVVLPTLLIALLISAIEELIFRGVLLNLLQQDYYPAIAALISSLIFALLHLIWEQQDTLPQLPGLWLMGIILVLARWAAGGNLGLAIGLHAGWVWAIACLDTMGAISYTGKISPWVTGIGGKPLAGVAGIVCLLATGAIIFTSL